MHLKSEDELSAEERVRQLMKRIFIRKEKVVEIEEESNLNTELKLRSNSGKGRRNLGSFDDA